MTFGILPLSQVRINISAIICHKLDNLLIYSAKLRNFQKIQTVFGKKMQKIQTVFGQKMQKIQTEGGGFGCFGKNA
ncbi:MAG: hypothetical protein HDR86_06070 [Bacteroides sp.]|nr:hypothetical protein [Bacteroides sp.]